MRDRLVLAGSASKSYAMTGWRCGWMVGPTPVVQAANALQSHETSNVNSITQKAAIAALTGPQQCVTDMLDEYKRRRDQLLAWLAEEPRLRCNIPSGAFYLFPSVSDFLSPDGHRTSLDFADAFLRDEHVVSTPGEAFDAPGYIRLSYATSLDRPPRRRDAADSLCEEIDLADTGVRSWIISFSTDNPRPDPVMSIPRLRDIVGDAHVRVDAGVATDLRHRRH